MVRVEASLLQKRAHGRARPPGRSFLGHASEGWPQAGAGRGKRGRENQRHRDLAGGIARSHGPPSFPATCAPRPTTGPTRFLRFNLEEPWTAAQRRVERRPPRPRLRGRLLRAPRHSASGPGSARREPGPPSERPRSRWCLVTPARASSGAAACGDGARPTDALGGSGRGRRSRRPPAPPHTRLEMTRQQRSPSKDGPIRPPSQAIMLHLLPLCAWRPSPTPARTARRIIKI